MTLRYIPLYVLALVAGTGQALPSHNDADTHVTLAFSLEPTDSTLLEKTLYEVSDPKGPLYGKFLTQDDAAALMQPGGESIEAVKRWLADAGVAEEDIQDTGATIHARIPEYQANSLLGRAVTDVKGMHARDLDASLPDHLRHHIRTIHLDNRDVLEPRRNWPWRYINAIQPASEKTKRNEESKGLAPRRNWPWRYILALQPSENPSEDDALKKELATLVPRDNEADAAADASADAGAITHDHVDLEKCKEETTPACLKKIYKMDNVNLKPNKKIIVGVAGFNEQTAQFDQLESFLKKYAKYAKGTKFSEEFINGGTNKQGEYPSGEANLDIQYAIAMAHNLDVRYYSVGGANHDFIPDLDTNRSIADIKLAYIEPWLELATYLVSLPDSQLPSVLSLSYGVNEQVVPRAYAKQVCDLFGQLGTRGVSILAASGDAGPGQSCQANDGSEAVRFLPAFPASCPYVTAVGATESNSPEVAAELSGGGFSDYFPRPAYQEKAVKGYLDAHGDEWKGYYNSSGRAFPDVAALGRHYQIYNHGIIESADGTSASTPVVAAIIATLNALRAQKNKPSLGFLNPWLYRIGPSGFTDITQGKSSGCPGTSYWGLPSPKVPGAGWPAAKGWDAVTGWGTPLFDKLRKIACS
ncbi:hypothetical protein K4F52_004279 [Lecanicillium sp. MT-2017a]|nr:hypothetical protein K4F52_004279 [Lecanicillium sp. MT-2017a]